MTRIKLNPPLELAEDMERDDSYRPSIIVYTGIKENLDYARRRMMEWWHYCNVNDSYDEEKPVINMHTDEMCLDRMYLTQDPDNWEAPVKRARGK